MVYIILYACEHAKGYHKYRDRHSTIATNRFVTPGSRDRRGKHVRPGEFGTAAVRRRRRRTFRSEREARHVEVGTEAAISIARRSTRTDTILRRSSYASSGQLCVTTVTLSCEQ